MACTITVSAINKNACKNSGGITSITLKDHTAEAANWIEFSPLPERSTVEEKYTFDRTTGIGYYTTTLTVDVAGYSKAHADAIQKIAGSDVLKYIKWITSNGVTATYDQITTSGTGPKKIDGAFAYVTEYTLATGTKMEDGASMKFVITIKSPEKIYTA